MKSKHEWKDGSRAFLVEADGSLHETPNIGISPQCGELPGFVTKEFLRLATREKELSERVRNLESVFARRADMRRAAPAIAQGIADRDARVKELETFAFEQKEMADFLAVERIDYQAIVAPLLPLFRERFKVWEESAHGEAPTWMPNTLKLTAEFPVEALRVLINKRNGQKEEE